MTSDQAWWLTMPPAEVAAVILPYFSSRPHVGEGRAMKEIASWCRTGSIPRPQSVLGIEVVESAGMWEQFENPDYRAVAEAMQVLERTGLLIRALEVGDSSSCDVGLTRLGQHALQTNTVRQHLGLGDAPPTA